MIIQRSSEEERWVARQRKLRQEKEDRQYQVSEFRQQVLEQHLDLGRPGDAADHRTDSHRSASGSSLYFIHNNSQTRVSGSSPETRRALA